MRIPSRVAAWVWVCALGLGWQVRAEEAPREWERASHSEQSCSDDGEDSGWQRYVERRQVYEDVFEYSFRIRVGSGPYDFITLHRVVREVSPWVPARAPKSVFLVHGDVWGFRGAFLASAASEAVPRQHSLAVFLARQSVDVWGIDLRWVNVPRETTDFSFMKNWNLGLHALDVGTGLAVARGVRARGSQDGGPMVLLGWSRGAMVSYAYLNVEARLSREKRHVRGFIPVDMAYTLAPEDEVQRQGACQRYEALARRLAAGQYEGGAVGALLQGMGRLALARPEENSPVPGFSNRQLALTVGAATHLLMNPPAVPFYHFTGGRLGTSGALSGLVWTREHFFYDFLSQASPYQSVGEQAESEALWCGTPDVPYDDDLHKVTVPVLYVGAEGGYGRFGLHTLSRLGSTDVTTHLVRRYPDDGARALDYGHADLFLADDAEAAVWTPILEWLQHH